MQIGIPRETAPGETRLAVTPETAKKLVAQGHQVHVQAGACLTAFALEAAPRTTRAQSMDVLSSQANIAGYKAVMIAADRYQCLMPMLMTAAGGGATLRFKYET